MDLNRSLWKILGFGGLGFLATGFIVSRLFSIAEVTVLVDRSGCDRASWRQLGDRYKALHKAHEQRKLELSQVVIVSALGEEVRETIPTPREFLAIETFGKPDAERLARLKASFSSVEVLSCQA
jgi:hypothetical protein